MKDFLLLHTTMMLFELNAGARDASSTYYCDADILQQGSVPAH